MLEKRRKVVNCLSYLLRNNNIIDIRQVKMINSIPR